MYVITNLFVCNGGLLIEAISLLPRQNWARHFWSVTVTSSFCWSDENQVITVLLLTAQHT
ncbi:hypothetical protein J1N35_026835 [Gossypium stocksii]|uniref:Uncharacterized protein n=1 Tax=Gossypium stocksii TaxID=47602 RepID=A0A9D3ZYJ5_9ROSI|nr:hypothetical protein J1N35_026835 [Gossypium stocksii]